MGDVIGISGVLGVPNEPKRTERSGYICAPAIFGRSCQNWHDDKRSNWPSEAMAA